MEQIPVGLDSSHGLQRCQLTEQGGTTDAQMAGQVLPLAPKDYLDAFLAMGE